MGGAQAQTSVGGNATQVFSTFVKLTSVASRASDMCGLDIAKVLHACRYEQRALLRSGWAPHGARTHIHLPYIIAWKHSYQCTEFDIIAMHKRLAPGVEEVIVEHNFLKAPATNLPSGIGSPGLAPHEQT